MALKTLSFPFDSNIAFTQRVPWEKLEILDIACGMHYIKDLIVFQKLYFMFGDALSILSITEAKYFELLEVPQWLMCTNVAGSQHKVQVGMYVQ